MKRSSRHPLLVPGFTLIEMMFVVLIIGVLAGVALPAYSDYVSKAKIAEGFALSTPVRQAVVDHYDRWGRLPQDNAAAGLALPTSIAGRHVLSVSVAGGAVHVAFRKSAIPGLDTAARLTLQPAISSTSPTSPLVWRCGINVDPPPGYALAGASAPAVPPKLLPGTCK